MDDLEITRKCAEAMGWAFEQHGAHAFKVMLGTWPNTWIYTIADISDPAHNNNHYNPLHDDAQAMALEDYLIARGYLHYEDGNHMFYTWPLEASEQHETGAHQFSADFSTKDGRRRAICQCVASLPASLETHVTADE